MKTIRTMFIAVTCFVATLNGPVWAEEADASAEPFAGHESAAWEVAYRLAGEYLSEDAISRLNLVVYHHVAEALCDDVHVDALGTARGIAAAHPENYTDLSEEERRHWDGAMLANFGMLFGVMLSEHADRAGPFCAEVHDVIEKDDWHYFDTDTTEKAEDNTES